MKKVILIICTLIGLSISAFADTIEELEFTWAYYELVCFTHCQEPNYDEYCYLIENGQCWLVDNSIEEIFDESV